MYTNNLLHTLTKLYEFFSSYVYNANGFKRDWSENEQKGGIVLQAINIDETIKNYCCKLSNIIKIMLKYVYNLYNLSLIIITN